MEPIITNKLSEIEVKYLPHVPTDKRKQVRGSDDVMEIINSIWNQDTIHYKEEMYVLFMDRRNGLIGYHRYSIGTDVGTCVSCKQILAIALKINACGIIMVHNHPSGNLKPSSNDIEIVNKMKEGAKWMDITLLDNLIISPNGGYCSFAEECW